MTPHFQQILTYALLPTVALTGGGLLELMIREILPYGLRMHSPMLTAIPFFVGLLPNSAA